MSAPEGTVNLNSLSVGQLDQLNKQVEEEVEFFSESLQQLKAVQQKFMESREATEKLLTAQKGDDILVPLTQSMYVPGNLDETSSVLVELGTGYYAEMPTAKAEDFFLRKTQFVAKQMASIQEILQDKLKTKSVVSEVLKVKYEAHLKTQRPTEA